MASTAEANGPASAHGQSRYDPKTLNVECLTLLGDVLPRQPYVIDAKIPGAPVFNLEGPICKPLHPWPNKINLYAQENHLRDIFGDGPLIACLANNHIMDYGEAGFAETKAHLRADEINYFGAGSLDDGQNNPLCINIQGLTVALFGFVCPSTHPVFADVSQPGVSPIRSGTVRSALERTHEAGIDHIVVCLHWGPEEVSLPRPEDIRLAREIIDAGADLVIGHHPHRIQPYEIYKGRHIFYSLGNCIIPEIDEESNYNEEGEPQTHFLKKQFAWHRESLGVTYYPATRSVKMSMYHFDGQRLASNRNRKPPPEISVSDWSSYKGRFRRAYYLGKLQYKLRTILARRRLPRISDLGTIVAIANELKNGVRESR